jgi:ubiquinone/menaquinone biosynthesis C-methylase UbiE
MRNASGTLSLLNSTAAVLPIADHSVDRVIALESAQHFKSLRHFVRESRRVLKDGGLFIIAIPVIGTDVVRNPFTQFLKLGVLSFTWASEHYHLEHVQSIMKEEGFIIEETRHIGSKVFEPLTDYCIKNRRELKHMILNHQTPYLDSILYNCVESIIYKSALKMKELSKKRIIDYAMIKGRI